jgi:hypothetical protein
VVIRLDVPLLWVTGQAVLEFKELLFLWYFPIAHTFL